MAVTLNKANLVLKDANGNVGKIEQLSSNDLAKIKTAVSDMALVVNQSNHTPIAATTTNKGVVQLATSADVVSGASDKVVTAEQLHNATTGTAALAAENLARIDAVVTEAGIPIDHTNTNQLKTAVTTLVNNSVPSTATSTTLGVVKPDNDTITIDSNGVLTATKAIQDKNGAQIDTTYFKSANGTFTGQEYFRDVSNSVLRFNGGNTHDGGSCLQLFGKDTNGAQGAFDLVACTKEDASDAKQLIGTPAGKLTWNDRNIVRSVNSVNADDNGNVAIENPVNIIRKNDGNDYYDDSDITSLIYAGNGAGTIRNEIANGNFSRVHPGQTIVGRVTGTTYVVVGCNIYKHRGDIETELTRNHIGLMPIQLVGNVGNLLWSGRTYAGSGVNNTIQGCAPWASDNEIEGKNQTSCYRDSYIAKTVLPKVDNLWLKPDFENQGISVLTFRNLEAIYFDTNATCMSNPNWIGCATNWGWTSRRLVLPSEPEIYGHYVWAGSSFESGAQHTQLPLYKHKEIHKVYHRVNIWLKDSVSAFSACVVTYDGVSFYHNASDALLVCPIFLIA